MKQVSLAPSTRLADMPDLAARTLTMLANAGMPRVGDLLGSNQSGLPGLRLGDLAADAPLVHRARALAADLLAADPTLSLPENRRFRKLLLAADETTAGN